MNLGPIQVVGLLVGLVAVAHAIPLVGLGVVIYLEERRGYSFDSPAVALLALSAIPGLLFYADLYQELQEFRGRLGEAREILAAWIRVLRAWGGRSV